MLPDGFLSPKFSDVRNEVRAFAPLWFELADEINRSAVALLPTLQPNKTSDPEIGGAALFARALQSFEATILLAERGMSADAGLTARSIVESAIYMGGLVLLEDFPERLKADNNAHYFKWAKALAEFHESNGDEEGAQNAGELRELLQTVTDQGHKHKSINMRELAKEVGLDPLYDVVFRKLSGESAHPSLQSIERHIRRAANGRIEGLAFKPQLDLLPSILSAAISAILGAVEIVAVLFKDKEVRAIFEQYNARHHALAESQNLE